MNTKHQHDNCMDDRIRKEAQVTFDLEYQIAMRAYSATVPEQNMRDTDYDAVIVFLGVHKAGALMCLAKQGRRKSEVPCACLKVEHDNILEV